MSDSFWFGVRNTGDTFFYSARELAQHACEKLGFFSFFSFSSFLARSFDQRSSTFVTITFRVWMFFGCCLLQVRIYQKRTRLTRQRQYCLLTKRQMNSHQTPTSHQTAHSQHLCRHCINDPRRSRRACSEKGTDTRAAHGPATTSKTSTRTKRWAYSKSTSG